MNGFMQTAERVGSVFFWLLVIGGACLGIWWLIRRTRQGGVFSPMEPLGGCIMFFLFLLPSAAIGAYLGGLLDKLLSIELGVNVLFGVVGLVVGFLLWWRAGTP